eukprot:13923383-Heterocapsa_arctica.AAC.1
MAVRSCSYFAVNSTGDSRRNSLIFGGALLTTTAHFRVSAKRSPAIVSYCLTRRSQVHEIHRGDPGRGKQGCQNSTVTSRD